MILTKDYLSTGYDGGICFVWTGSTDVVSVF